MPSNTPANVGGLPKILYQGLLADAQATVYTAPTQPPNARVELSAIWICNTDSTDRLCTLRIGVGALTAANSLIDGAPIQPFTTYVVFDQSPFTLSANMVVDAFSDVADKMTITIFGKVWQS